MIPTWVTDQQKNVFVNQMTRYVKGRILVPPLANNPVVTPAAVGGNPGQSPPVIYEGGEDAVTEVFSLVGAHDAADAQDVQDRLEVEITDVAYRRRFMNRPILANQVFGTNLQPFFLTESVLLEPQQSMILQFSNPSAAGVSNFRNMAETRVFQASALARQAVTNQIQKMRKRKTFLNPYWFTSDERITLPAGGSQTFFFTSSRDYFLILQYIMCQTVTAGVAGDTQEVISFTIRDAKTKRPLSNQPVTLNTGTGTSRFPFVLPTALMIEPFTQIEIDFNNLITDATTDVFFTFFGVGIFLSEANPWREVEVAQAMNSATRRGAP